MLDLFALNNNDFSVGNHSMKGMNCSCKEPIYFVQ